MSSRGARRVKTHRMDGAIAALTPLGFSKKLIRDTIYNLKKAYGDDDSGWYFVEENYYKLVIDKIIEDQEEGKKPSPKEEEEEETKHLEAAQTCEKSLVELGQTSCQADSRINADISVMEKPKGKKTPIKLDGSCNMVPCVELGQVPPLVRKPCYGWISEDEE